MKKQTGLGLVSAIFIVVILSLIGSYIVSIASLTRSSSSLESAGVRAYYAAKSGLEWGIYGVTAGAGPYNCPASPTTLTFTQGGLSTLQAVVTCTSNSYTEGVTTYNMFQITAVGSYGAGGNPTFASRTLYTTVVQPGI